MRQIVFNLCPYPGESADVYQLWCQSVQPFDSFLRLLNVWPPTPPPPMPPVVLRGDVWLAYVPDESADVNQSWCQSVQPFDSFPRLLNVWPPKTRNCPLVSRRAIYLAYIHSQMNLPNLVPIGPAVWQLQHTFEFVTPKTPHNAPWDIEGRIAFSLCPFPDECTDLYLIWCQSVPPFDSFPKRLNLWPPKITPEMPLGYCEANGI